MKEMRDFLVVIGSTAVVSALLTVFFNWRGRLLRHTRGQG